MKKLHGEFEGGLGLMPMADVDVVGYRAGSAVGVVCPDSALDGAYFAAALSRRLVSVIVGTDDPPNELEPRVALIDHQAMAGGIDVVVDRETDDGVRWHALRGVSGAVDGARLIRALPRRDGVAVLSHARSGEAPPDVSVQASVIEACRTAAGWTVVALNPDDDPTPLCEHVILLVKGTVCGLAAAERWVRRWGEASDFYVVTLETSADTRALVSEALGAPVIASAPTRWRLGQVGAADVLNGRWPGQGDRTMQRVVADSTMFVCSQGRSLAWA